MNDCQQRCKHNTVVVAKQACAPGIHVEQQLNLNPERLHAFNKPMVSPPL